MYVYDEANNLAKSIQESKEYLEYKKVKENYFKMLKVVARIYSDAMNIIHYMHDKYAYEAGQLALHDTDPDKLMAFGIAGFSVAIDSLSAIKYAFIKEKISENQTVYAEKQYRHTG